MTPVIGTQRGIALVITLLVVALLTITVLEFSYFVQVDQHMARNALNGLQAALLARSGINLGEAFLLHDDDPAVDAFTEEWCPVAGPDARSCDIDDASGAVVLPPSLRLRVRIVDEGGKLNLNLVRFRSPEEWKRWRTAQDGDPKTKPQPLESWRAALGRLLEGRGLDPIIADEVLDYWDRVFEARYPNLIASRATPGASGTPTAVANPTPGQPANPQSTQLDLPSLDDASVIPALTPAVIRRLRPVLTALPSAQQRVNANTAPPEVLRAVVGDDEAVNSIVTQRTEAPMKQTDLVSILAGLNQGGATSRNYAGTMLGVTSSFYLIRASGVVNPNPLTGRGGISRSASMLVQRLRRAPRPGVAASAVPWTLTQLDWQKEGGLGLFREGPEPGMESDGQVDSGLGR